MTNLYRKWLSIPKAIRWPMVILFYLLLICSYLLWQYQRPGGAFLYGYNHTDRPIFSYWVNDHWGGNGGVTCCRRIRGDTLKVVWIVDVTQKQFDEGLKEERYEIEVPNPPRQRKRPYEETQIGSIVTSLRKGNIMDVLHGLFFVIFLGTYFAEKLQNLKLTYPPDLTYSFLIEWSKPIPSEKWAKRSPELQQAIAEREVELAEEWVLREIAETAAKATMRLDPRPAKANWPTE